MCVCVCVKVRVCVGESMHQSVSAYMVKESVSAYMVTRVCREREESVCEDSISPYMVTRVCSLEKLYVSVRVSV